MGFYAEYVLPRLIDLAMRNKDTARRNGSCALGAGQKTGALQLEALWNDVLNNRAFHLHCAYPRSLFRHDADAMGMRAICDEHSHVLGDAVN
jgi:hypothetical protein